MTAELLLKAEPGALFCALSNPHITHLPGTSCQMVSDEVPVSVVYFELLNSLTKPMETCGPL